MSTRRQLIRQKKLKSTKTTQFLLPILGFQLSSYPNQFISSYIIHSREAELPKIVVTFENISDKHEDFEIFKMHIYKMQNIPEFRDDLSTYDDEDKELVLVFDLKKEFIKDYELFIQGKYSKFSDKLKDLLIKVYGKGQAPGHKASMFDTLYPKDEKRKLLADHIGYDDYTKLEEVLDSPDLNFEVYRSTKEFIDYHENKTQKQV